MFITLVVIGILLICGFMTGLMTDTFTVTWNNNGEQLGGAQAVTADEAVKLSLSYGTGNISLATQNFAFKFAKLQSIFLLTDKSDMTLTFSGGEVIALKAGVPYIWLLASGLANPFTHDQTTVTIANATTPTAGKIHLRALQNA